jgi:hypothetical protein
MSDHFRIDDPGRSVCGPTGLPAVPTPGNPKQFGSAGQSGAGAWPAGGPAANTVDAALKGFVDVSKAGPPVLSKMEDVR